MITQLQKTPSAAERAEERHQDVHLVGSGITTDLLAAILARGGLRVVVAPPPTPFVGSPAITTVPYTAELLYLLADRFRVPEIANLAMFGRLPPDVRATSGVKQSLGFLYHRPRRAHDPVENLQFSVPGEHAEWHASLPDVEHYTRTVAEKHGATYVPVGDNDNSSAVDEHESAADDASLQLWCVGSTSPHPGRIAATAHFETVTPFEQSRPPKDGGYTQPWSEGTTVHAFRGGWIQVAAFDNHPAATTPGCAVSLSVSSSEPSSSPGRTAEASLDTVLAEVCLRYPDIGLQLRGARRLGPWQHTADSTSSPDRTSDTQHPTGSSRRPVILELGGDRGEVLFGQDFTLALELVHATAAILLVPGALASRAATESATRTIEQFQDVLLSDNEQFAAAARIATRGFPAWNAFLRAWLLWSISSALALKKIRLDAVRNGNWAPASKFDRGIGWFDLAPGIADTVAKSASAIRKIETEKLTPSAAAGQVFRLLSQRRVIPPLYKFGDPAARRYNLKLLTRLKLLAWTFTMAPRAYRGMLTADNITAVPNEEADQQR